MPKRAALSKSFISELGGLTEEFNRVMDRSEFGRFMDAIRFCDFDWAALVIQEMVERKLSEKMEDSKEAISLKEKWGSFISANGGVDLVTRSSYRMSRENKWPWWGKKRHHPIRNL